MVAIAPTARIMTIRLTPLAGILPVISSSVVFAPLDPSRPRAQSPLQGRWDEPGQPRLSPRRRPRGKVLGAIARVNRRDVQWSGAGQGAAGRAVGRGPRLAPHSPLRRRAAAEREF